MSIWNKPWENWYSVIAVILPGSIVIIGQEKFPGMIRISEQRLVEGTAREI